MYHVIQFYLLKKHLKSGSLYGCGCSLNAEYAIERALLEFLQVYDAREILLKDYAISNHKKDLHCLINQLNNVNCKNIYENPFYVKCVGEKNIINKIQNVKIIDKITTTKFNFSVKNQLFFIINLLNKKNYKIFYNYIKIFDIYVVFTYVINFEKFCCIEYNVISPYTIKNILV